MSVEGHVPPITGSVLPEWTTRIPYQQQSVLILATRGPDGVRKHHPAKAITIAYRATLLRAAMMGRFLAENEAPDSFMALDNFCDFDKWKACIKEFFNHVDELPHHYVAHIAHAAQIVAVHHPLELFRDHWGWFYLKWCHDLHVNPETPEQMNKRLDDWGKAKDRYPDLVYDDGPNILRFMNVMWG